MKTSQKGPPKGAIAIVVGAILIVAALFALTGKAAAHPQPRAPEQLSAVVSADAFAGYPRIQETYRMAAAIPDVLDGLHCYCECDDHSGHYSLLDCFASEHGAGCDICLTEAQIAFRMTQEGRSLDEIRAEIDGLYGS